MAPAAIDGDNLSGDKPAFAREKPYHGGIKVLRHSHSASIQGLLGFDERPDGVVALGALGHRGGHESGCDDIEADTVLGVSRCRRTREPDESGLRSGIRVGSKELRRWRKTQNRTAIENAAAAALEQKLSNSRAVRKKHGLQIQVLCELPSLFGQLMQ